MPEDSSTSSVKKGIESQTETSTSNEGNRTVESYLSEIVSRSIMPVLEQIWSLLGDLSKRVEFLETPQQNFRDPQDLSYLDDTSEEEPTISENLGTMGLEPNPQSRKEDEPLSDSYSKNEIDLKFEVLEQKLENKLDRVLSTMEQGFITVKSEMQKLHGEQKSEIQTLQSGQKLLNNDVDWLRNIFLFINLPLLIAVLGGVLAILLSIFGKEALPLKSVLQPPPTASAPRQP